MGARGPAHRSEGLFCLKILGGKYVLSRKSYFRLKPRIFRSLVISFSFKLFHLGMFRGKYEWAGDRGSGDCSLLVRDADTEWDDGSWQCSVSPSKFKAS